MHGPQPPAAPAQKSPTSVSVVVSTQGKFEVVRIVGTDWRTRTLHRRRLKLDSAESEAAFENWQALAAVSAQCPTLQRVTVDLAKDHAVVSTAALDSPAYRTALSLCDVLAIASHVSLAVSHLHAYTDQQGRRGSIVHGPSLRHRAS